jgi:DNA-binding transcriptional ArsR family regulator
VKPERRTATEEEARALSSPLRLRILRLCLDTALTNKQIAEALDKDPASVLYHVRRLVRSGFLAAEDARRGARGAREVPYRATGKSWALDVVDTALDRLRANALLEAFLEDARRVGPANVESSRLGLRLTPDEYEELKQRLADLLNDFAGRSSDGEPWSLFVGLHRDDRPVPAGRKTGAVEHGP